MTKVYLSLRPDQVDTANGIGQVVMAQYQLLPGYGITLVNDPNAADVIACHISQGTLPRVDVLHLHGLYFDDVPHMDYQAWHYDANSLIASATRRTLVITVPSPWVAEPFKRDMHINPVIIPHGINLSDWTPGENGHYILYAKGRESDVCFSEPAYELAKKNHYVVSTQRPKDSNKPDVDHLKVVGTVDHDRMKTLIASADIYLATTLETFGIATLEALAAGVPVLGYAWGGNNDLVTHLENGYLVKPGDVDALEEGIVYIRAHRDSMSHAASESAKRYQWPGIISQYADLYRAVHHYREEQEIPGGKASIIITNYNYAQWVGEAIDSALNQEVAPGEVIVVDDGSTDNSRDVIMRKVNEYKGDIPLMLATQENQGVAAARNHGAQLARYPYLTFLDADDKIAPQFVGTLSKALDADRGLGIAYGGLKLLNIHGDESGTDWPPEFNWKIQSTPAVPPSNCIPSACMFRKTMWVRSGGVRQEYAPGEDTEFWTRGLSLGFGARRVVRDPLFIYRAHDGSASRTREYTRIDDRMGWMVTGDYPFASPVSGNSVKVRSYMDPMISVIIPVGHGHENEVSRAIESIEGQSFIDWEILVINDSGGELPIMDRFPYVRLFSTTGGEGAGSARNMGIDHAKGKAVFFLDADDYLLTGALEKFATAYTEGDGHYIYSGVMAIEPDGNIRLDEAKEYNQKEWKMQHSVSVLMDVNFARDVMFDPALPSWEDWEFFLHAAVKGYCGKAIKDPLLAYRFSSGSRRMKALAPNGGANSVGSQILAVFAERYGAYFNGGKDMSSCCGGNADPILIAKNAILNQGGLQQMAVNSNSNGRTRMEYTDPNVGAIGFKNPITGHSYRGGNNNFDRYCDVLPEDVEFLKMTGRFKVISLPAAQPLPTPNSQANGIKPMTARETQDAARKALEQAKASFNDELPVLPTGFDPFRLNEKAGTPDTESDARPEAPASPPKLEKPKTIVAPSQKAVAQKRPATKKGG